MPTRVKLCAIAKNEGAYLSDWVFHHLHFGFDAVEVWINGTDDPSGRILHRISAVHPQVSRRNADHLLATCLAQHKHFQHVAYNKMARRARREGFTHVAFLDLDEYWTPRDFTSSVHEFLPDDDDVKVVSFPWCVDLPDTSRRPFERPLGGSVPVQVNHLVKSVIRLDESLRRVLIHTAKIDSGRRLLAREEFPLVDQRAQSQGSMVTVDYLTQHWGQLPEAFVFHAVNRSQQEYFANVAKGYRQSGREEEFKTNRQGYLPTEAPVLTFRPPEQAAQGYVHARSTFHHGLDLGGLAQRSERMLQERGDALAHRIETEPELRARLGVMLRGTTLDEPGSPHRVIPLHG